MMLIVTVFLADTGDLPTFHPHKKNLEWAKRQWLAQDIHLCSQMWNLHQNLLDQGLLLNYKVNWILSFIYIKHHHGEDSEDSIQITSFPHKKWGYFYTRSSVASHSHQWGGKNPIYTVILAQLWLDYIKRGFKSLVQILPKAFSFTGTKPSAF